MSSKFGTSFGDTHANKYAKVLEKWAGKVEGVSDPSGSLFSQWGADLDKALGEPIIDALMSQIADQWKSAGVDLPSADTLRMFSQIAIKYSLYYASSDLLRRLIRSVKEDKDNPAVTDFGMGFFRPTELISRASQTLAQIFDMAKDRFNEVLNRFMQRKEQFTGRKRWRAVGDNSRHSMLDGEIRAQGETFTYKKEAILGPRPVGGSPHDWSNCSCYLEYERTDGKWVRTD